MEKPSSFFAGLVISKAIVRQDLKKRSEWKRFAGSTRGHISRLSLMEIVQIPDG
jgi:hypothetical protein